MSSVGTYLTLPGTTEEAFNLYKSAFGGEFLGVMRYGDMPPSPDSPIQSDEAKQKIMHIALSITSGHLLMGTDLMEETGDTSVLGNSTSIAISPDTREEADRLFAALSEGGSAINGMADEFFGYFGSFADKFGVRWMIVVENQEDDQSA